MVGRGFATSWVLSSLLCVTLFAKDIKIEAYGDSLTAGFLARYNLEAPPPLKTVNKLLADMLLYVASGLRNKERIAPYHAADLAWPERVASRIREEGHTVTVQNFAFSGARSEDLASQVSGGQAAIDSTALFFVGANDLCIPETAPNEVAKRFIKEYQSAIQSWDKKHKNSTAYLVPVAEVHRVFSSLKGFVWLKNEASQWRCDETWKLFPYCPRYLKRIEDGSIDGFLKDRISAMNQALKSEVKSWNEFKNGNRYEFMADVHNTAFKPAYFSIDCFHLSALGQDTLAKAAFHEMKL